MSTEAKTFVWQTIGVSTRENEVDTLQRVEIYGGWLVQLTTITKGPPGEFGRDYVESLPVGLTFVPDPEHKWDGSVT